MILWEKSDCSPDWTELLSILADLAKLTEKCSKNCGLLPLTIIYRSVLSGNFRNSNMAGNRQKWNSRVENHELYAM